jgi:hypothetical protein
LIWLSLVLLISIDASAQKGPQRKKKKAKKVVVQAPVIEKIRSNSMRLCPTLAPQPSWFLEVVPDFKFPASFQEPSQYRLLTTIDTAFSNYLRAIPYHKSEIRITIPLYMNHTLICKDFIISRTETMDSVLQAKYPQLMSFKAFAEDNSLNAARIDCDESSTKMMITYDKKTYFVHSILFNNTTYFVCYSKDDPNFIKESFER